MQIDEIQIDERNEEHVTAHGVSVVEISQVFANQPRVRRNRKGRVADHLALGTTDGGRPVMVAFILLNGSTARPITAWEA